MRVARHQDVLQLLRFLLQQVEKRGDLAHGLLDAGAGEEFDVHSHLVVPRAARMDLLAHVAERGRQARLHLRMDVFAFDGELAFHGLLVQFPQLRQEDGEFILPQQSHLGQHRDMGHRAHDVPRSQHQVQLPVLPDRERVDLRRIVKSFRPNLHTCKLSSKFT